LNTHLKGGLSDGLMGYLILLSEGKNWCSIKDCKWWTWNADRSNSSLF